MPATPPAREHFADRVSNLRAPCLCDGILHRSVYRYVDHLRDDRAVRQRIKEIAATRVRYSFERIQVLLRREGWRDNPQANIPQRIQVLRERVHFEGRWISGLMIMMIK